MLFMKVAKKTLNAFRSGIFLIKAAHRKGYPLGFATQLKILTPKQMLQRSPIALAQVQVGNTSKYFLNESREIMYSLYQTKEITKKIDNVMNSIKL